MTILVDKEGDFDIGSTHFVSWSFRVANQLFTTTTAKGSTLRHYFSITSEQDAEDKTLVVTQIVLPCIHFAIGIVRYPKEEK